MATNPPLKWHGGKHYLAPKLVALMPPHVHYVEPYAGGLSVLLARSGEGVSEVINDIHSELANFWSVLAIPREFAQFYRCVRAIPFSSEFWEGAEFTGGTQPQRAAAFFIRCRQSMAGRMDCFAPLSRNRTRRGMNEQVSAWLTAVEGLPAVHARLKRVVVLNRDAIEVIKQQDGPNTFFYLDPPYLHETRATTGEYEHEMTTAAHAELLLTLYKIQGNFMLSGYRSELYDSAAQECNWIRADFDLPNNAASGDEKRRMTECVWMNYARPLRCPGHGAPGGEPCCERAGEYNGFASGPVIFTCPKGCSCHD